MHLDHLCELPLPPLHFKIYKHHFHNYSGKDDRDLGRSKNSAASECKQLACLSVSKAWRQPQQAREHQCQQGPGLWSLDVTVNLPCMKIRGPATPVV